MPELPEVETIRRGILGLVVGKKVRRIEVLFARSFVGEVAEVLGKEISGVRRRGKALIMDLGGGLALMIHLRMTGQIVYVGSERFAGGHPNEGFVAELPNKHTRVVIELDDGSHLYFNDQRKFGFIKVIRGTDEFLERLGPEPWDKSLDEGGFYERLMRHAAMVVKAAILDQSVIAGVGNIYADEALFFAGVHPARRVESLSREEAERILVGVREAMEKSIAAGGSSLRNYVKADGTRGDYLDKFAQVFNREGEACPRCGVEIIKIRVAGRGTHVCPVCQK
jgi:formamidopyrimidine-DNA glycosylase